MSKSLWVSLWSESDFKYDMRSEKVIYLNSYQTELPTLEVEIWFNEDDKILVNAMIDTGCTRCIISEKITAKYIKSLENLEEEKLTGAGGKVSIYYIDKKLLRIPNNHKPNKGIKIPLHTGGNLDNANIEGGFDLVLGIPFLEQCTSFWLDATNKTFQLEFWS